MRTNIVNNSTYYVISESKNWKEGDHIVIGQEQNSNFLSLLNQGFVTQNSGEKIPSNMVVNEVVDYIQTGEKSPMLGEAFQYDVAQILIMATDIMNTQTILLREMIYEEVRKAHFPQLPSRQTGMWVIPNEKESLKMAMQELKSPRAKIFELSLTGKIHRVHPRLLELTSFAPIVLRETAYCYWLGNRGEDSAEDEIIFEGLVQVKKVIDANSIKAKK